MVQNMTDCYTMSDGNRIPCIGYGTYKAADGRSSDIIKMAIDAGYRYFDTASFYQTEGYLAEAIQASRLPREEFFITSKLWKDEMGYKETKEACRKSLKRLQTDYLDLYLIHWPLQTPQDTEWKERDRETWRAMEELCEEGVVRSIGLSNFLPHHIENILADAKIRPVVDQLEFHPGYSQEAAVRYCQEHEILVQAWSPMGRMRVLKESLVVQLAQKYQVSPAQICLRYAVQRGIIPLPKASGLERMKQNQDLFSFVIGEEDMYRLMTMPQAGWSGEHPDRETVPCEE